MANDRRSAIIDDVKHESSEPYRLLFPIGFACAAIGASPWILFRLGYLDASPMIFHGRVMFHGFLTTFISGFLMTAVPKMSGTAPCGRLEAAAAGLAALLQVLAARSPETAAAVFAVQIGLLLAFVGRRLRKSRHAPAPHFIFIPAGLASGLLGALLLAGSSHLPPGFVDWGRLLAFQAFVLNPIVGLGSRLVPVLSRVPDALLPTDPGGPRRFGVVLLALNASFFVEAFADKNIGLLIRAATLTAAALLYLRLAAPMRPITIQGIGVRLAVLFLIAPYYLIPIFPGRELHWMHLGYIGGMGLLTLLVATRVILAHGDFGFETEKWSRGLLIVTVATPATALLRALSFGLNDFYRAAAVAATAWLIALAAWWLTVGLKIKKPLSSLWRSE